MISAATQSCSSDAFLQGGGEAGALMRAHDWSPTLGDPSTWPQPLKTLVRVMLHSSQPMFTAWGPERIMLYNDAYAPLCGFRHPAIGKTFSEVWFDIMDAVGPILDRAYGGEPIHMDDITFTMHRHGYPEEAHFAFSYTPVLDEEGEVVGVFCACKETTAAVAASSSLQAEQGRLRELFQQAPGFVAILRGPEHVFEIANDSYLQMIGNSRDVIGKPVREALPETVEQGFVDLLDRVYASGEPFIGRQTPVALHRQPGAAPETRYCDFIYQPIRDSRGLITGLFVQGHDVTDAKRAETAQREGDERYRALVEHAAVGVTHAALDGRWIMMNRKACQMLGYDEGELIGKRFQDFTHPEDRHDDIALNRALDAGEIPSFRREKRYLRKDGSPIWIEATVSLVRDERGAPAYRISVYQDIHERKLAAEALADSQRRLNAVLNNASVSIFLMNERQECDYMNAAAERLTGFRLDEVRGGTLHDVIHHTRPDGSHYPLEECPIDRAFPENSRMQGEEVFVHKNGSFYPVAYTASPIRDDSAGSVVGTVVEVRDIRGEKEAQERQQLLLREMDHRVKNLFAITSGMVALSARTVSTPQEMAQTLRGRIDALARANELVSLREYGGEHQKPATLDTLIKVILRPYMRDARDPDSFVLSGPIVPISRSVVTSLSLVLHETVTNAAKYGALSCRDGRIEITWALSEVELHLRWRESGGPSIFGPPSSEGFGSILVQRSVVGQLQGRVDYDWRSEGLVFDLAIPVERLSL